VNRDGVAVDPAVLGTAIPVDPGNHVITASAPGKRSWSTRLSIGARADRVSVAVPILADEPSHAPLPGRELESPQPTAAEIRSSRQQSSGATQRVLAIVAAALGLSGVATGSVFGIQAASSWNDVKSHCNPYPYCDEVGAKLSDDAHRSSTISNIAFIAGGVGIVSGVVLWFTAPASSGEGGSALRVGPGHVQLDGQF
jgi:hypothetical protein